MQSPFGPQNQDDVSAHADLACINHQASGGSQDGIASCGKNIDSFVCAGLSPGGKPKSVCMIV